MGVFRGSPGGRRSIVLESLSEKPIDLDRVVARKIPRSAYLAGARVHHQSPYFGEEFEDVLVFHRSSTNCIFIVFQAITMLASKLTASATACISSCCFAW